MPARPEESKSSINKIFNASVFKRQKEYYLEVCGGLGKIAGTPNAAIARSQGDDDLEKFFKRQRFLRFLVEVLQHPLEVKSQLVFAF
jgi:hypothetical protein